MEASLKKDGTWKIKLSLFLNYIVLAILMNTIGVIIVQVIEDYNIRKEVAGSLESYKDFAVILASFLFASYIPKWGLKNTMLMGLTALTIICILSAVILQFWIVPLSYVVIGLSFAVMKIAIYATIGTITKTQKEHTSLLNFIEGIFMVGVLIGPLLFSVMIAWFKWNITYWLLAALTISAFILLLRTNFDKTASKNEDKKITNKVHFLNLERLFKYPMIWFFLCSVLLYVMIEQSLLNWLPFFCREIFHVSREIAAIFLSIFAAAICCSRLIAGYVFGRWSTWLPILLVLIVIASISIILILFSGHSETDTQTQVVTWYASSSLMVLFALIGFCIGPILPTICSIALKCFNEIHHSTITGLIVIFAGVGGTLGAMLIGIVTGYFNIHQAFYFVLVPLGLLFFALIPYKKLVNDFPKDEEEI